MALRGRKGASKKGFIGCTEAREHSELVSFVSCGADTFQPCLNSNSAIQDDESFKKKFIHFYFILPCIMIYDASSYGPWTKRSDACNVHTLKYVCTRTHGTKEASSRRSAKAETSVSGK